MRPLGGMVLVVGGLWCAWRLWRGCGPLRTLVVGIGFLAAAGLGTVLAGFWVNQHVRNLEYDTFAPQPLYG